MTCSFGEYVSTSYTLAKYALVLYIIYLVVKVVLRKLSNKALNLPKWSGKRKTPPLTEWIKTQQGNPNAKMIKCFNPGNMETLCEDIPAMTPDIIKERINTARNFQETVWKKTSFDERRRVLGNMLDIILKNKNEICKASCRDSGKTIFEAYLGEILMSCEKLRYLIKYGEEAIEPDYRRVPLALLTKVASVEYYPLGVIGMIVPWNYPFHNILGSLVTSLFTGNAVVVKVSEWVTYSLVHCFEKIIHQGLIDSGYSPDLIQFVIGYGDAGEAVIRGGVDHVFFIGSPETGKRVMRAAADTLTPVTLELGGKDPFIICDDANYEIALDYAVRSVFINNGQNCVASERFYVHEKIFDKFSVDVQKQVKKLRIGYTDLSEPLEFNSMYDCGAMTMTGQIEKIEELIADAIQNGAKVVSGGKRPSITGQFFPPTVLVDVKQNMRICQEECFGPVMLLLKFSSDEEVIAKANDTQFGLGSYVFSKDYKRAEKISKELVAGVTMINDYGLFYLIQSLPFGGSKISGFGKFGGVEGLRAFCRVKSFVTDRFPMQMAVPKFISYPTREISHLVVSEAVDLVYGWKIGALPRLLKLLLSWPADNEEKKSK